MLGKPINTYFDRITVDPAVCSGKPIVVGTRIMVRTILGMVAGGSSASDILEGYPDLKKEDVIAALAYAAAIIDEDRVILRP